MRKKASIGKDNFILMFVAFALGLILSNLLAESSKNKGQQVSNALFIYKGIDKLKEDISEDLQQRLAIIEKQRLELLERAAIEQHIYQYAHLEGITADAAAQILFKVAEPSEEQISEFFKANANQIKKPYFQIKGQIKKQLTQIQRIKTKNEVLDQLIKSGNLHFL
mgnify:CR=1 FL=1